MQRAKPDFLNPDGLIKAVKYKFHPAVGLINKPRIFVIGENRHANQAFGYAATPGLTNR